MYYSEPKPSFLKKYGKIIALFLVFVSLFFLIISVVRDTQKKSRDMVRLSGISQLRSDLGLYFIKYSRYPEMVYYVRPELEETCIRNLCLNYHPVDPATGQDFIYLPCKDASMEDCVAGIVDPQAYLINFNLESLVGATQPGPHLASQAGACVDETCR
jgi:hypothetical protein